jgi:UDP-3-O-[3-hydroxymyristoyl] glucosamine N-acyltransferase
MADSRFFERSGPFRLAELADMCGAELGTTCDPDAEFVDVAPLAMAGHRDISFLDNPRYLEQMKASAAGACIMQSDMAANAPPGMAPLLSPNPYKSYALVARAFYAEPAFDAGISLSASIGDGVEFGEGARVDAGAVIGAQAVIGARCRIGANAVIGDCVAIGDDSLIGANVTLSHCIIGSRVVLYPGVRIGQPGFGYAIDPGGHVVVPQLGRVVVEDDVQIGANSAIDRGAGPDTVIGAGTVIDNLVHVAHNVKIGRGCAIAGQSGISGSTELGDLVIMAGQSGLSGHIKIGAGAQIGGQCGVLKDLPPGARVMGTPARPVREFFKEFAVLSRFAKTPKRAG